ncbi:MAG: GspH/FimT family pseudopilin [Pseudomonadota bacterium]
MVDRVLTHKKLCRFKENISPKISLGVTLLELLVTIAVASIIMLIAVPSFRGFIKDSQMTRETNTILSMINFARTEAIGRQTAIQLKPLDTNWQSGLIVNYLDENGQWLMIKKTPSLEASFDVTSDKQDLTFFGNGFANHANEFRLCDNESQKGRTIVIAKSGQVQISETACEA